MSKTLKKMLSKQGKLIDEKKFIATITTQNAFRDVSLVPKSYALELIRC